MSFSKKPLHLNLEILGVVILYFVLNGFIIWSGKCNPLLRLNYWPCLDLEIVEFQNIKKIWNSSYLLKWRNTKHKSYDIYVLIIFIQISKNISELALGNKTWIKLGYIVDFCNFAISCIKLLNLKTNFFCFKDLIVCESQSIIQYLESCLTLCPINQISYYMFCICFHTLTLLSSLYLIFILYFILLNGYIIIIFGVNFKLLHYVWYLHE